MSKKKNDGVFESMYAPHLAGGNPDRNRGDLRYRMHRRVLGELAMNRFRWSGLPAEVDRRFVEMTLFHTGLALFFWHPQYDRYVVSRGTGVGQPNMYDNPTRFRALLPGSNSITLSPDECVPIWANYYRSTDMDIVNLYATQLADLDRSIEIAGMHQRVPFVLTVPESQRLSYLNLVKQAFRDGEAIIIGTDTLDVDNIKSMPYTVDKDLLLNTILAKQKIWNECMTMLGINNANQDKKERLVAAEVGANDSQVLTTRNIALNSRRYACELINRQFPVNVSVDWGVEGDEAEQTVTPDSFSDDEGDENDATNEGNGEVMR